MYVHAPPFPVPAFWITTAWMNELPNTFHLSITGLRVRPGFGNQLRFRYHALRSFMQARKAPGVLHVAARRINGVEHTVTAWRDRDAMLAYVRSGPHLKAMRIFHRIATGATCSFTTDHIPDWPEVHARWKMEGVVVGGGER